MNHHFLYVIYSFLIIKVQLMGSGRPLRCPKRIGLDTKVIVHECMRTFFKHVYGDAYYSTYILRRCPLPFLLRVEIIRKLNKKLLGGWKNCCVMVST